MTVAPRVCRTCSCVLIGTTGAGGAVYRHALSDVPRDHHPVAPVAAPTDHRTTTTRETPR